MTTYVRQGEQIKNMATGEIEFFNSIALAKKASRKLPKSSVITIAHKQPQTPSKQKFHYKGAK